jgi:hypothetical protein
MTESEWNASEDPARMLGEIDGHLRTYSTGHQEPVFRVSDRKLRLFACACVRQVWHLLTDDAKCDRCSGKGVVLGEAKGDRKENSFLFGENTCPDCKGTGRVNRSRHAVEVAERFADGEATVVELETACRATGGGYEHGGRLAATWAACPPHWHGSNNLAALTTSSLDTMLATAVLAALLREIVGNPFRPVTLPEGKRPCGNCDGTGKFWEFHGSDDNFDATDCCRCDGRGWFAEPCPWLTPTVLSLARVAYEERPGRYEQCPECRLPGRYCRLCHSTTKVRVEDGTLDPTRLAILADPLEEAGCADPDILSHLRSPGPHVRGCWALDLILGKE